MSIDTSDPEFIAIVRKIALLKAQVAQTESDIKDLITTLGEPDFRAYPAGDYILEVQHNWALNPNEVRARLKPGQVKLVEKTTIDPQKVKALYPEVYAESMKDHSNPRKFVIKPVTDA